MSIKRNWVYDLEVFPNFFSNTLIDLGSNISMVFVIYEDRNDLSDMIAFMEQHVGWLIGYNNSKYDDILMRYLMKSFELLDEDANNITQNLYELSGDIIGSQRDGGSLYKNPRLNKYLNDDKLFRSIDLMSMMAFDKNRISLKKVAVSMQWPVIQDLPKPFDEKVTSGEVSEILKYNMNDVLITKELCVEQKKEVETRALIGSLYDIDLMSSSRASMADKLMIKFWSEETNQKYSQFKDLRTIYETIDLKDCLSDTIGFKTPDLKSLHKRINSFTWRSTSNFSEEVRINNTKYDVLLGGLHSVREPLIYEETDEYELWDLDVASYYPSLMINLGIFPAHLSERFLKLFTKLVKQRLDAKKSGDKDTADALKIAVNSSYGKLNFEHGWLFDTKASYTVTLTGQLFLLMLVEALELKGIEVFYANTDGLTCKIKKGMKPVFDSICEGWQAYTNLELEFTKYKKCVIRDVNNYIIQTDNGYIKSKGCFSKEIDMTKGYNNPIVAIALEKYFIEGTPIETSIYEHDNIYDFCKSQKVGSQYVQEYHDLNDEKTKVVVSKCQKTNRYYASKSVGKLYKRKDNGQLSDMIADHNVTLFNNFIAHEYMEDYKIDYRYYIAQANRIIWVMEPAQLSLPF